jgi:hypothetical protein
MPLAARKQVTTNIQPKEATMAFEFPKAFEGGEQAIPLGRLYLGSFDKQHAARLMFTPDGNTVLVVSQSAVDSGAVIICPIKDIDFVRFSAQQGAE